MIILEILQIYLMLLILIHVESNMKEHQL